MKVQLWQDNSDSSGWYVCEVSVDDLINASTFTYPCYAWLSVISDDARVDREITLESETSFKQVSILDYFELQNNFQCLLIKIFLHLFKNTRIFEL